MGTSRHNEEGENAGRVSRFAWRLERAWRALELPVENPRIVVAVSGGADSTALLLALDELRHANRLTVNLFAAHLDHGLRAEAGRQDAEWIGRLAGEREMPFITERADLSVDLERSPENLEQAARHYRYEFLARTAGHLNAPYVLTGHTVDDQAETVLLRLMRGSGLDGLAGMKPIRKLGPESKVSLVRPLLTKFRRAETVEYCAARGVEPRQDLMNLDPAFSRVRVRQQLLPILESFNPRIVETLARSAKLIAVDSEALETLAAPRLNEAARERGTADALAVTSLAELPPGLRRRVIRQWLALHRGNLRRIGEVHVRAVDRLLAPGSGGRIAELPGGSQVERRRDRLLFRSAEEPE